jgi:hypothetical protein
MIADYRCPGHFYFFLASRAVNAAPDAVGWHIGRYLLSMEMPRAGEVGVETCDSGFAATEEAGLREKSTRFVTATEVVYRNKAAAKAARHISDFGQSHATPFFKLQSRDVACIL